MVGACRAGRCILGRLKMQGLDHAHQLLTEHAALYLLLQ